MNVLRKRTALGVRNGRYCIKKRCVSYSPFPEVKPPESEVVKRPYGFYGYPVWQKWYFNIKMRQKTEGFFQARVGRLSYGFWMWTGLILWQLLAFWRLYVHRNEWKDIKRERMLLGVRLYPLYKHLSKLGMQGEEVDYRMKVHIANKELNMDWEYPDRFFFPLRDPNLPTPHEYEPGKQI